MEHTFTFTDTTRINTKEIHERLVEFSYPEILVTPNSTVVTLKVEADTLLEAIRLTLDGMNDLYASYLGGSIPLDVEDAIWGMRTIS